MGFERYKHHGMGHFRAMEREGDAAGLLAALDDPRVAESPRLLGAAILGLRRLQVFDAAPRILPLLETDQPLSTRSSVARALGPMQNPIATPALRKALDDPSHKVQMWTIRSLGELKDRQSVTELVGRLGDKDWGVRASAAKALGEIGDQAATEALIAFLSDPRRTVRLAVVRALVALRDPRALAPLERARDEANPFKGRLYADGIRQLGGLLP